VRKWCYLLALALLWLGGCRSKQKSLTEAELEGIPLAQRDGLPTPSGGFVLAVGGETITSDEVIAPVMEHFRPIAQASDFQRFKEQARPGLEQILVNRISDILLYKQAKRDAGEQIDEALEKAADAEVRRFVVSFGGDYARAEEAIKQMGFDWQSFKEYHKKMILSQSYIVSQLPEPEPVTYSELLNRYNEIKDEFFRRPAMLTFRLIDIQPAKLKVTDPNQTRLEKARDLADVLLGRLREGEDFGELALVYSHGHRAMFGGLWKPVQPESLAKPYDILALEAEKIAQGKIAGPIKADGHFFIMKLEEKRTKSFEPFQNVQKQVEARIILDRRRQAVDELQARLVQQAELGQRSEFIDFCLEKIYRMSKQ